LTEGLGVAVSSLKCNTLYQWRESGNTGCFLYPARRGCNMGYHQLSQEERYIVGTMRSSGKSQRAIALELGRAPSTISRERKRNATRHDGGYRAEKAHGYAKTRRRQSKTEKLDAVQWARVDALLKEEYSPDQAAQRLAAEGAFEVSHETIYKHVRQDKADGGGLWKHMRIMSKVGRKKRGSPATRGQMPGKKHISERPVQANERGEIGHFEGDTVIGSDKRHCVLTLVDRKTGYTAIEKMTARTKEQANAAMSRAITKLRCPIKTITLDNGTEFHGFAEIERTHALQIYFATPYHSWERGTNENTNGLIRQYIPKGHDMSNITQRDCDKIATKLNNRPRWRLGYETPAEKMALYI
jgi:transposase, IS30 family